MPILTLHQARRLVVHALKCKRLSIDDAIAIVDYHLRRNTIAYQSHAKKRQSCAKAVLNMR